MTVDPRMQQNIDAYVSQLDQLMAEHPGKYVVFSDAALVAVSVTSEDAFAWGYRHFGREPFLVQRVEPIAEKND